MGEELARRLETEAPELLYPFYGMRQVRYQSAESSQYSALQSAAVSLSQKDYEMLRGLDRLVLQEQSPFLYISRFDRIPEDWREAWLGAEARILEALTQAA